jgi:tetratricopeptide (TPR) repeat protein
MQNKMSIEDLHKNTDYDIVNLFSGIDLEYIAKRRSTFRTIWEKFRKNPSDLTAVLRLIHAVFRVEQQEAIKNVLINPVVVGFAPLLLSLELEDKEEASETLEEEDDDDDDDDDDDASDTPGKEKASETLIKWKQFLFGERKVNEGIEILENALKTGLDLPSIKSELYHSHYAWAQYEDPITKAKAKPSVRIEHLRRVMELGGTHDYIYKFMAEAYHENGDDEQARINLSHAYKLNPELSGAIKISKALGFPQGTKPQSSTPKSSEYKYSKPAQIPSHEQINEWKQKGEWNNILEYANPYDYFSKILPKARELLRQIADSLGSYADSKSIDALIVLLKFGYYWDVSFAAMTSLSKVGDEKVLAVLEKFEARTIGGRAILDESISYLKKRISYQTSSSNAVTPQELLDQSKKAFFKDGNYQQARILLESLLPRIDKSDFKYLDVVILLARSCAETRDYGRAFELIKSIFSVLPEKYQKHLAQEMASWFWSDLGFREYSPASDSDYCFALQADIEAVLAEDNAGEALYKLKSLTRNLEKLGAGNSIKLIRTLIRTEAPGSDYADDNRGDNYMRKTDLSPVMKDFFAKFDEAIKTGITEKIQKMLEGIELSDDFVVGITIEFDDDDIDDDNDDEEGDDNDFFLESD